MIIGSLAGPLCAGGGFCAGSAEVTEHQRISALAYTYSAALPAMLATTASETINLLQSPAGEELLGSCRELVKVMWGQLDPRSEWVRVSSVAENPMMLLVLKQEIVKARGWGAEEVDAVLGDVVDEVCSTPSPSYEFSLPFSPPHTLFLRVFLNLGGDGSEKEKREKMPRLMLFMKYNTVSRKRRPHLQAKKHARLHPGGGFEGGERLRRLPRGRAACPQSLHHYGPDAQGGRARGRGGQACCYQGLEGEEGMNDLEEGGSVEGGEQHFEQSRSNR